MKIIITLMFLVLLPYDANSTTWGSSDVSDPIKEGENCSVQKPMSWGSYIYQWPSKYDQVFWPQTTENGIWFCESSGFIALINDFEGLTIKTKERINKYLKDS